MITTKVRILSFFDEKKGCYDPEGAGRGLGNLDVLFLGLGGSYMSVYFIIIYGTLHLYYKHFCVLGYVL